jgi:ribonucleoside-diphosphate reductase alpha chain
MGISTLSKMCSQGIEPWVANTFIKKVPTGSFTVKNKYLSAIISSYINKDGEFARQSGVDEQWKSIVKHNGSVQHLDWMDQNTKDVFKTAFEIDQRVIIQQAADRQVIMVNEQSQSVNIFMPAEVTYEELYTIHMMMYKSRLKSGYYLRSQPAITADTSAQERKPIELTDDVCVFCT